MVPIILLVCAAAFAVFLWVRLPRLVAARTGRIVLLFALLVMPLALTPVGVSQSLHESKQKDFCMSCHEMEVYDTSLHIDDPEYLPAYHYQNRLVPQATACYTCHTDYTLYGDIDAKLNGMKHLWVHYLGDVPAVGKIELYNPYPNDNCLQCHRGARRFEKKASHTTEGVTLELLYSNQKSCVSEGCHDKIHEINDLGGQDLWGEPRFPVPPELKKVPAAGAEDPFAEDPFAESPDAGAANPDAAPAASPDAAPAPAPDAGPRPASELKNVDDLWDEKGPDAAPAGDVK